MAILARRPHPEQGFRSCLGVLRLFRGPNRERAEAVCARALEIGAFTVRSIASILDHHLDRTPAPHAGPARRPRTPATTRRCCTPTSAAPGTSIEVDAMLHHPTLNRLDELGLHGCAKGLRELENTPTAAGMSHAEWLGLLLEYEVTLRNQKRFESRARRARLRHAAVLEDIDFQAPRGLDRALFLKLGTCQWIHEHRNVLLTGPCGIGKSWLACALGDKACWENLSVLYLRAPRLFADLALGRGDGRYARLLRSYSRVQLLILDDWGPEPLTAEQRRDLLEIVEERCGRGSLLITSQLPLDQWHHVIGNPTLADAILDRIVHNAYRIELSGESLRKQQAAAQG